MIDEKKFRESFAHDLPKFSDVVCDYLLEICKQYNDDLESGKADPKYEMSIEEYYYLLDDAQKSIIEDEAMTYLKEESNPMVMFSILASSLVMYYDMD